MRTHGPETSTHSRLEICQSAGSGFLHRKLLILLLVLLLSSEIVPSLMSDNNPAIICSLPSRPFMASQLSCLLVILSLFTHLNDFSIQSIERLSLLFRISSAYLEIPLLRMRLLHHQPHYPFDCRATLYLLQQCRFARYYSHHLHHYARFYSSCCSYRWRC
jgi:hypothetical protein